MPSWFQYGLIKGFGVELAEEDSSKIVMAQPTPSQDRPQDSQAKVAVIPNHPLAVLAGKFEGEFWEATLKEMARSREQDRNCSRG